ncbi:MAG: exodeoxyribonuclease III [Bacteroidetes bacterium]|nr:exodeoxyribonuclease III [Bacteroidota bacterium]
MRIISYNVNGIRAAIAKGLLEWLKSSNPDIVCFQEIKAHPEQIPTLDIEALGYYHYWFPAVKKGYSGVGILSRQQPDKVVYGIGNELYDYEGRVIRADFGEISVLSVYHPSGTTGEIRQDFKMKWLDDFLDYINELKKTRPNLVISGDYNICHQSIDIHDPIRNATSSGFLPEERAWVSKFLSYGFIDSFRYFVKEPHHYSWWSYRVNARDRNLGWRIDYHMVSEPIEKRMQRAAILPMAKHSDHCPVMLEIDFK